ncbi:MAG: glycosyltransferase family 2 protein [Chloroflexi bacterium]|nr:glycosyltransferase family 2 protein [Chloroflexota bacterium]
MILFRLLRLLTLLPLLLFSLRRLIFALTALLTPVPTGARAIGDEPDLLVLVPCHNDGPSLPALVQALLDNGYPHEHLRILLIDDGSTDNSSELIADLATANAPVHALHSPQKLGKAAALNLGLQEEPWGEIVAVYDADHRPEPGGLRALVTALHDPEIAAVSARTEARNALTSASAYYSAIERLVHQRITMVAKDRLELAPAILGSHCACRRDLLASLEGFASDAEDSDLTLRIISAGYRIRYVESSVAYDEVPATVGGYWRQHVRWSRGFQNVAIEHSGRLLHTPISPALRLELFLFSLGYLDRLALLVAFAQILSDRVLGTRFDMPGRIILGVLLLPYLQVIAALVRTKAGLAWWMRLPYLVLMCSPSIWQWPSTARPPRYSGVLAYGRQRFEPTPRS